MKKNAPIFFILLILFSYVLASSLQPDPVICLQVGSVSLLTPVMEVVFLIGREWGGDDPSHVNLNVIGYYFEFELRWEGGGWSVRARVRAPAELFYRLLYNR